MGHREKFIIQAQTQLSSFLGSAIVFNGLTQELGITLKPVQEMEFEWYFRDHLFRSMNKGLSRLEISTIPKTLVDTYLKYRNANVDEISILLHSAIENLVQRDVINHGGTFIELKGKITRKQCGKCFYVCYVSENEALSCFRCSNDELRDFPIKKTATVDSNSGDSGLGHSNKPN
jgi:hypothetical protein